MPICAGIPLFFAEELALVLMIVATFAGFSLMVAENRLISIDMFGTRISDVKRRWIAWFMRLAVLVLAVAIAVFSVQYLLFRGSGWRLPRHLGCLGPISM